MKPRILAHMASFSTLPSGWLPWTANALTVVVMAAATMWSAAQRPAGSQGPASTLVAQAPAAGHAQASKKQTSPAPAGTHLVRVAAGEAAAPQVGAEGLLPVVYQPPVPGTR